MNDKREYICNKVCFIDGHAYVAGGKSKEKAEKFDHKQKKWISLQNYPIKHDLFDWSCALAFTPLKHSQHDKEESLSNDSKESDNDSPEATFEYNIHGKVDGLEKILLCLPFSNVELQDFQSQIENLGGDRREISVENLSKQLQSSSSLLQEEFPELNVEAFLKSYLATADDKNEQNLIDLELLKLLSAYSCKVVNLEE